MPDYKVNWGQSAVLDKVEGATVRGSRPRPGTGLFLKVKGAKSQRIYLVGNEWHEARTPYKLDTGVRPDAVKAENNF